MEVVIPVPSMDFDFNSALTSPTYLSAPTTPRRFGDIGYFTSAPSSPNRISEFYRSFDEELISMINEDEEGSSAIPFDWEDKPGTPKSPKAKLGDIDFAFEFSQDLEKASLSADELFDGGKIKPLKPPPGLQINRDDYARRNSRRPSSPRSPKSAISQGKQMIQNAFSPRNKKQSNPGEQERGRERSVQAHSGRRASRSHSPYRVAQFPWEDDQQQQQQQQQQQNTKQQSIMNTKSSSSSSSSSSLSSSSSSSSKGYMKWRLKDFLLFRSASEGRASDKDPLKKYTTLIKKHDQDIKNSSFRSTDSQGSNSGSVSKRRGQVSAHEMHYNMNRAAAQDLKKKTFLPYKQGILGLAFSPAHALSNGFGTITRR